MHQNINSQSIRLAAVTLLVLLSMSCEERTTVKLDGANPPTFFVSGSGRLERLTVCKLDGELLQEDLFDGRDPQWQIVTEVGYGELVNRLRAITYGLVPNGYKQVEPKDDQPPPALESGKLYLYRFVTVDAPHGSGYFEIRDGKSVEVQPCWESRGDRWIRVECRR